MRQRVITTIFLGVSIGVTLGALSPAAWAQGLSVKSDAVKINFGTADFGHTPHALGSPAGSGNVGWEFSTVNGSLHAQARVSGFLFLDSLDPGCARLTIEFKSSSGAILATRHKDVCVTATGHNANDSTNQVFVQEAFGSSNLNQVVLRTQSVVNNQVVSTSPAVTSTAPNKKTHNVLINSDNADFGTGLHVGGGPNLSGYVSLTRDNGNLKILVSGNLYYDSLFSEGCAKMVIHFQNSAGSALKTETVQKCGPGGNANDSVNKEFVSESFASASQFKVRLRVGQVLPDGSFVRVKTTTCDFAQCR